jgi:DGQHR domain-containing protein
LELQRAIGDYAKYNLLGELEVVPRAAGIVRIPAFRIENENTVLYDFAIDAKDLLRVSFVARREVGDDSYYQRMVKRPRLQKIADYVEVEKRIFPNDIVVSFVNAPKFTPYKEFAGQPFPTWLKFGILQFPESYRACWIVDGQHRLYGMAKVQSQANVVVVAFDKLQTEEQAKYFLDINGKQQKVEPELLWDLSGKLIPSQEDGMISNAAKSLNELGPLAGRIYIPLEGPREGRKVKLSGICGTMKRLHLLRERTLSMTQANENPMYELNRPGVSTSRVAQATNVVLRFVDMNFEGAIKDKFLLDNSGLAILIALEERIISATTSTLTTNSVESYLEPLKDYLNAYSRMDDINELRQRCTSGVGRDNLTDELSQVINGKLANTLAQLPLGKRAKEAEAEYSELERDFREVVLKTLAKAGPNATKERIGAEIQSRLAGRRGSERSSSLGDFLTMGECKDIIVKQNTWEMFDPIFVGGEAGFDSRSMFEQAVQAIIDRRNMTLHGRGGRLKYGDIEMIKGFKKKLRACINAVIGEAENPEGLTKVLAGLVPSNAKGQ